MNDKAPGTGIILLWMAMFMILGVPFVYLIWDFINHALAGHVIAAEAGLAAVGVTGLAAVLWLVGRRVRRWEAQ